MNKHINNWFHFQTSLLVWHFFLFFLKFLSATSSGWDEHNCILSIFCELVIFMTCCFKHFAAGHFCDQQFFFLFILRKFKCSRLDIFAIFRKFAKIIACKKIPFLFLIKAIDVNFILLVFCESTGIHDSLQSMNATTKETKNIWKEYNTSMIMKMKLKT